MPRATSVVTRMVTSSPSRPPPETRATRTQAAWVIRWSAAMISCETATPPLKLSAASGPTIPCHCAGVTGSLLTGVPAVIACSMPVKPCSMGADPACLAFQAASAGGSRRSFTFCR